MMPIDNPTNTLILDHPREVIEVPAVGVLHRVLDVGIEVLLEEALLCRMKCTRIDIRYQRRLPTLGTPIQPDTIPIPWCILGHIFEHPWLVKVVTDTDTEVAGCLSGASTEVRLGVDIRQPIELVLIRVLLLVVAHIGYIARSYCPTYAHRKIPWCFDAFW